MMRRHHPTYLYLANTLSTPPKWDTISSIHRSIAVRSLSVWFVVTPLLAALLQSAMVPEALKNIEMPFKWQVFFFASLVFTISTLLYVVYCPKIIKDYSSWSDFSVTDGNYEKLRSMMDQVVGQMTPSSKRQWCTRLLLGDGLVFSYQYSHIKEPTQHQPYDVDKFADLIDELLPVSSLHRNESIADMFSATREAVQTTHYNIRRWIALLHLIGGFLLLWVAANNVWTVVKSIK